MKTILSFFKNLRFFRHIYSRDKNLSYYFIVMPPSIFKYIYINYFKNKDPNIGTNQYLLLGSMDSIENNKIENMYILEHIDIAPIYEDYCHGGIYSYKDYKNNLFYEFIGCGKENHPDKENIIRIHGSKFTPKDSLKTFLCLNGIKKTFLPWVNILAQVKHPPNDIIIFLGL